MPTCGVSGCTLVRNKESPKNVFLCIIEFFLKFGKYLMQTTLDMEFSFSIPVNPDKSLLVKKRDVSMTDNVYFDKIYEEEYEK